jgi:hypothetical protein
MTDKIELGAKLTMPNGDINDNVLKTPNEIYLIGTQMGIINEQDSIDFTTESSRISNYEKVIQEMMVKRKEAKDRQFELMSKYYLSTAIDRS